LYYIYCRCRKITIPSATWFGHAALPNNAFAFTTSNYHFTAYIANLHTSMVNLILLFMDSRLHPCVILVPSRKGNNYWFFCLHYYAGHLLKWAHSGRIPTPWEKSSMTFRLLVCHYFYCGFFLSWNIRP
jgi:hypothetical protein